VGALRSSRRGPARYSAFDLARRGALGADWPRSFSQPELKPTYDAIIIGAGVHGLATAYYLAKNHGMTNVAVLDKAYIGGGAPAATPPSCARTTSRRRGCASTTAP
jgi:heterodisulfide reductase subunit A-like polyferredoxin